MRVGGEGVGLVGGGGGEGGVGGGGVVEGVEGGVEDDEEGGEGMRITQLIT